MTDELQNPTDNTSYMPLKQHIAKPLYTIEKLKRIGEQ
jgi:hypothetical protein